MLDKIHQVRKKKIKGGVLVTIGYLLSPLSWWNDLVLNIPLAYAFAFLLGLISKKLFFPFLILGYWLTNIIGFLLIHYGLRDLVIKKEKRSHYPWLLKVVIISIVYTLMVVFFVKIGWLKFPLEYFKSV